MLISVDDNSPIDFIPTKCSICTDIIWRDTITFQCLRCNKDICINCIYNIIETTNVCPYCRYKMTNIIEHMKIGNIIEDDSLYSNDEESVEIDEIEDTNTNNEKNNCYKIVYLTFLLIVVVLLFINAIYLLSLINHN